MADVRKNFAKDSGEKPAEKPADKPVEGEAPEVAELRKQNKALSDQIKSTRETLTQSMRREAKSTYRQALKAAGAGDVHASDLADAFIAREAEKLTWVGDDLCVKNDVGELVPITSLATDFMKSDRGKHYMPPKETSNLKDGQGKQVPIHSAHPFAGLTYDQIMKHPDATMRWEYMKNYPKEWGDKKVVNVK